MAVYRFRVKLFMRVNRRLEGEQFGEGARAAGKLPAESHQTRLYTEWREYYSRFPLEKGLDDLEATHRQRERKADWREKGRVSRQVYQEVTMLCTVTGAYERLCKEKELGVTKPSP